MMNRIKCPRCESTFTAKKNMYKHYRNVHEGVQRNTTETDDDNEVDARFACNICAKRFEKAQHLYNHRIRKHTKE